MATNPNDLFADLVPGHKASGPVYGAPAKVDVPTNYEPDPDRPGAFRPQKGGPADPEATADSLDDQTLNFMAQQVLSGAPMPPMGMGKQAAKNRQQVLERVAKLAGAQGLSGADQVRQIAHYKAQTANISNLEKQLGTVTQAEQTALANGQQFIDRSQELPLQTETPLLNSVIQGAQRNIGLVPGHETIAAMDAAYNTFVNEYAKVVSGSPSGAGTMSDSARHEAMETIRSNAGMKQKLAAFAQMKADMANRIAASHKVITDSYNEIGNKPGYEVPSDLAMLHVGSGTPPAPPGGDNNPPPGVSDMTPDQQAKDKEFLATNPTPEQYATFMSGLLNRPIDEAAISDRLAAAKKGGGYSGAIDEKRSIRARIEQENKLGVGETAVETLANQGSQAGLSDEASGVGNALAGVVAAPFTGKFDPVGDYTFGRDVERQRIEDARQQLGYGGSAIEFVSGLASGRPTSALATLTGKAAAVEAGKSGALGGFINGFGSGEGAGDSAGRAAGGAAVGGALGRYAPAVVARVTGGRPSPAMAPEVAAAADAEGVPLIRPMVDPASRGKFGELESNPVSQNTIRGGVRGVIDAMENRVKSLSPGTALSESDIAGQRVQTSLKGWLDTRQATNRVNYGEARTIAGGKRFEPTQAIAEADGIINDLQANPNTNAAELTFIKGMREDLAQPGGKTVDEIRKIREGLSNSIRRNGLTMDQEGVRALRVLNKAKDDIAANVPNAAAAYNKADRYFSATQPIVDDLQKAILGTQNNPIDPQVAIKNLRLMMADKSTGRRFARIMGAMDTGTRQDVAATWAEGLGRKAAGDNFGAAALLSNTQDLSPSALRTAFGPEGAQSIKNLQVLARALRDSGSDINYSRSGTNLIRYMAKNFIARVTGLGAAAVTGGVAGGTEGAIMGATGAAAIGAVGAGKTMLSARAMVDPKVSRWLADAVNVSNRTQAHTALRKLSVIIQRDPSLSAELTPIYDRISKAFSGSATPSLAAEPQGQDNAQQ